MQLLVSISLVDLIFSILFKLFQYCKCSTVLLSSGEQIDSGTHEGPQRIQRRHEITHDLWKGGAGLRRIFWTRSC